MIDFIVVDVFVFVDDSIGKERSARAPAAECDMPFVRTGASVFRQLLAPTLLLHWPCEQAELRPAAAIITRRGCAPRARCTKLSMIQKATLATRIMHSKSVSAACPLERI